MKRICFFTGSRAEYGILSPLMQRVKDTPGLQLQIVATNMHLSPEYGMTVQEIERDGFTVDKRVEMLVSSDTAVGTVKSCGLGMIGYADALAELKPDLIVVLGDRFEMLGVAQAALMFNIPVAHLHGGEITLGAYDDAIRHAITKLSHLHFTSTEEYRRNVIQMGEAPERVFNVGALGVDNILNTPLIKKEELEDWLEFTLGEKYVVCTFHPVTKEPGEGERQVKRLINALNGIIPEVKVLITLPNADTEGRSITSLLKEFAAANPESVKAVTSMGRCRYYTAVAGSVGVVGNSSSGLIEAPTLGVPTLNIGNRQKGRARGESVIDVDCEENAIADGLRKMMSDEMRAKCIPESNPYAKADTLQSILNIIETAPLEELTQKGFYKLK